ncbi:MAG: hypothetical protein R2707_14025 [Acidimicrobiales bacterium]
MGESDAVADAHVVDDDGVVRIGSVVFAMIRPAAGHERAFNHWYERDHFYTAGCAAPGVFSAGRFVEPITGVHLALYFVLPGYDDARIAFAMEQVALAATENRMFTEREHLHTWSYAVESATPGTDGVPLALALDHRYGALAVAMVDLAGPDDAGPPGPGPSLTLRPRTAIMPSDWEGEIDPDRRRIVIDFHREAPAPVRDDAVWSGAFLPVVFGTDTHVTDSSPAG